jgi:hypothetical protein
MMAIRRIENKMNLYPPLHPPLDPMPPIPAPIKVCRKATADRFKKFRCDEASYVGLFDCPDCPMMQDEAHHPGAFGKNRHEHVHTGVDLYAPEGTPVRAMEKGKVIAIEWFTGKVINMPWWENTKAVYIEGDIGVFNYGEIRPFYGLKVGDQVEQGQIVGHVMKVLKHFKGRPMSMLHVELYDHGWTDTWGEWKIGAPKPIHLKDPTPYLLTLADPVENDPYQESANLYKSKDLPKKELPKKEVFMPEILLEESLNDLIDLGKLETASKILEGVNSTFSKYEQYKTKVDKLKEKKNV